jgi:hypothetical protein
MLPFDVDEQSPNQKDIFCKKAPAFNQADSRLNLSRFR